MMNPFLSHVHKKIRDARLTREGATHAPKDVARFQHKRYARFPSIDLPAPELEASLADALRDRRSAPERTRGRTLTRDLAGSLFFHALGARPDQHRNYPSGGALFPVETYLFTTDFEAGSGIYHYDPTRNALEFLWPFPEGTLLEEYCRFPCSSLIVFTSVWARSSAKYGDLSYAHALIESGHMSQNLLLVGTALGLELRPMAGFRDDDILRALDLDPLIEQPIHSVTLNV